MCKLDTFVTLRRRLLIVGLTVATLIAAPLSTFAADSGKLKIGVIGSGKVGSALGSAWIKAGHEVMFSSTHLEEDQQLAASLGALAHAGTPREAAAYGDVVLVSIPFSALPTVGKEVGDLLKGKVVIDTVNAYERRDGAMAVEAMNKGVAKATAELLPGAHTVRAFNAIGANRMGTAGFESPGKIGIPLSGQDEAAVATVATLIREIGFEPVVLDFKLANYLHPGTELRGEHSPDEIREIVKTLK